MSRLARLALVTAAVLAAAIPSAAQESPSSNTQVLDEYLKTMRQDLTARRDATLRAVVQLTPEEAKTFWPLQKEYDQELKKLGDARKSLLQEWGEVYNRLTDAKAKELAGRLFELNDARSALRKKYFDQMSAEVSVVAAVQFLQLETQFETMADLQLATYVPVAIRQP
jgi:hypothetical protein